MRTTPLDRNNYGNPNRIYQDHNDDLKSTKDDSEFTMVDHTLKAYTDLLDAIRLMNSNHDHAKVLEFIVEVSAKLLKAKDSTLFLLDEATNELYARVAKGSKQEELKTVRFKADCGVAGWVAKHGLPRLVNDVSADSRFYQNVDEMIGFKTNSIIAVPLLVDNHTIGVLEVINSEFEGSFTNEHVELLQQFADQAAVTLTNTKRYYELSQENQLLKEELGERYTLISGSDVMERLLTTARRAAATDSTILIQSESGTGKELIARFIHNQSPRRGKPFIAINCAALNDELLESELFGHEKGAFTGAHSLKKGKLELANGGTFFFDEIGELKMSLQAKLLRVLQEHAIDRVGGQSPIRIDVRIIAATNRDLKKEVDDGQFRQDLFYRINVIPIDVPPLRERPQEIEKLANFFISRYCVKTGQRLKKLSKQAVDLLQSYSWPGNVRELENIIERIVVLVPEQTIDVDDLPADLRDGKKLEMSTDAASLPTRNYHDSVNLMRKTILIRALNDTDGNQAQAAKILGIQPSYLSKLIKDFDIKV